MFCEIKLTLSNFINLFYKLQNNHETIKSMHKIDDYKNLHTSIDPPKLTLIKERSYQK